MTLNLKSRLILTLTLACLMLSGAGLTGCKQGAKDADKILDAQDCLDTIPQGQASECVSKVDGLESEAAYLIRCVGKFVDEGFGNSSKIANAIDSLKNQGEGAAGSTAMIVSLAFTAAASEALNATNVQAAFSQCTQAKAKGLIFLAGLAQTSTVLASLSAALDLSNPASLTGANLQTAMTALSGNAQAQSAVGGAVVAMYNSNCLNGGTTTGAYCTQFASAVSAVSGGTSNPSGIGQQIMLCYTAPSTTGCSGF